MRKFVFLRSIVDWWRKLTSYHEMVAEGEATYSSASSNGNADEQYVIFVVVVKKQSINKCHLLNRFIVKDRCTSYSGSQRSLMVMQVLLRTKYDESEKVDSTQHFYSG